MRPMKVTPLVVLIAQCETVDEVLAQQIYECGHAYGTPWDELAPELRASIVHETGEVRRRRLKELKELRWGGQ